MKKRVIKLIVCIMLISALMIGFCTAYASAATPVWLLRAKAGIAAAMMAANLVLEPIGALEQQGLADAIDPLGIVQTVQDTAWSDYIDQSVIVVRPDKVTIDGVPYSEIWLGDKAANSLRASGWDFTTAYNILANQSEAIEYASGEGHLGDIPVFEVDNKIVSQNFVGDPSVASGNDVLKYGIWQQSGITFYNWAWYDDTSAGMTTTYSPPTGRVERYDATSPMWWSYGWTGSYWLRGNTKNLSAIFDDTPFSFDYTSGQLDMDPISSEDGLLLRVPSSYDDGTPGSVYNYDIHDLVNLYPQVDDTGGHELVFDPDLNPDFDVDLDMGNALGDIITAVILAKLADLLGDHAETIYAPMPEKGDPEPQPGVIDPLPDPDPAPEDPVPGTTIADTDWTKLDEILRWIQSTIDSIRHLTESLQTMLDSIFDAIQSAIQHIAEIPEAIRELADKILEDIELGPAKLFDKALDILKTLFLPLLLPIRAMMGLWHYVVEWIQSITTPFTWIFGIMSGTSGNMVLPIYALLAGGICISIYKALGR